MKRTTIENKLIKHGYIVVYTFEGNVMAYKGNGTYRTPTLNALYKMIFH